jgi:GntR family transcriptional regulator / MocR family aminotransferase
MELHVSLEGRKNLSREIYRQVRSAIVDGRLRPGDPLPPTREMARRLGVARMTVTIAYDRLAGEGFILSRVGSGTFVNEHVANTRTTSREPRASGVLRPRPFWNSIRATNLFAERVPFDFRTGVPDATLFPYDAWRKLLARELRAEPVPSNLYGHPAGHRELRDAIARHIGVSRAVQCSGDDVTITNGTQQALDVIGRVLVGPGDRVAVEDPGYPPPRRIFESHGACIVGVRVDEEGLVVEELPDNVRLVYLSPSHQFPLGVSMSLPRRIALLEWADRNNAAIVEDDYDREFRFSGRPIEPLQVLDTSGRVIYVGTFSKTLLPAMRLGFVVAPQSIRDAIHAAKFITDWHSAMPMQAALARFINDGGFARHVRKMSAVYRVRHEKIAAALSRDFADILELLPSTVGLHLTAIARNVGPNGMGAVLERAASAGIALHELSQFSINRGPRDGLVIGYGAIATARLDEGLDRLRECFL